MKPYLAFVAYPVKDLSVSRRFYSTVFGIEPHVISDDWLEYHTGESTFVITQADADHPAPVRGALAALEVADLDAEAVRLREHGIVFRGDIVETPICRFMIVLDPDQSEVLIHERKPAADTTRTV